MGTKCFYGNCVNNPFKDVEKLSEIIDSSREITKRTFLKNCDIDSELVQRMNEYQHDFRYYKNKNIYFFTWSCVEYFYK